MGLFFDEKDTDYFGFFSDDRTIDEFMTYMTLHPEEDPLKQHLETKARNKLFYNTGNSRVRGIRDDQQKILLKLRTDMIQTVADMPQPVFKEYIGQLKILADSLTDERIARFTRDEFERTIAAAQALVDSLERVAAKHDKRMEYIRELRDAVNGIAANSPQAITISCAQRMQGLIYLIKDDDYVAPVDSALARILDTAQTLVDSKKETATLKDN